MSPSMRHLTSALLGLLTLVSGCTAVAPLSVIGDQCDKASDCEAPLICALGRCRRECEATRDCALGLRCIQLPPPETAGVCQLPDETACDAPSDCQEPLVCAEPGGCLLPCDGSNPCIAGESCGAGGICETVPGSTLCVYDSDCAYPLICDRDQSCVIECTRGATDCAVGLVCVQDGAAVCEDGPCMCRIPCDPADPAACPAGTECTPCGEGLDCSESETDHYCERPAAGG